MMCRTHFVIGTAAAIVATQPRDLRGYLTAVLGGAVGSLVSDLDQPSSRVALDMAKNRLTILITLAAAVLADQLFGTGIWESILKLAAAPAFLGGMLFAVLCLGMPLSAHRGFSHSFLCLGMMTGAVYLVSTPLAQAFFWGFLSHLALDLLNKRGMKLFYPWKKGFCLGLCYADGRAADFLTNAGLVSIALYLVAHLLTWLAECFM